MFSLPCQFPPFKLEKIQWVSISNIRLQTCKEANDLTPPTGCMRIDPPPFSNHAEPFSSSRSLPKPVGPPDAGRVALTEKSVEKSLVATAYLSA
jgi:hypothetical protein